MAGHTRLAGVPGRSVRPTAHAENIIRRSSVGRPASTIRLGSRNDAVLFRRMAGEGRLRSRHGPLLGVGVGSARTKVLVGDVGRHSPTCDADLLFWSFLIVAVTKSGQYVAAAAVTVVAVLVLVYIVQRPGSGAGRLVERWAAGRELDREHALDATYAWTRGLIVRSVPLNGVWTALLSVIVGAIAGAAGLQLVPIRDPGRRHRNGRQWDRYPWPCGKERCGQPGSQSQATRARRPEPTSPLHSAELLFSMGQPSPALILVEYER